MPNPPSANGNNAFQQIGFTQLCWGTEAFGQGLGSDIQGSYIVVSGHAEQSTETINYPQSDGLTAVTFDIVDGQKWIFTVQEDNTISPPTVGTLLLLENVFISALGEGILPYDLQTVQVGWFKVENNNFSAERGAYGTRNIMARAYVAIPQCNGGGNPTGN